jgi:Cys-tRNA(Pro)/Cys-tRNA(Cys) deacylase
VYLDETAHLFAVFSISAAVRGIQILLAPADYIRAVGAKVVAIAKGKE